MLSARHDPNRLANRTVTERQNVARGPSSNSSRWPARDLESACRSFTVGIFGPSWVVFVGELALSSVQDDLVLLLGGSLGFDDVRCLIW